MSTDDTTDQKHGDDLSANATASPDATHTDSDADSPSSGNIPFSIVFEDGDEQGDGSATGRRADTTGTTEDNAESPQDPATPDVDAGHGASHLRETAGQHHPANDSSATSPINNHGHTETTSSSADGGSEGSSNDDSVAASAAKAVPTAAGSPDQNVKATANASGANADGATANGTRSDTVHTNETRQTGEKTGVQDTEATAGQSSGHAAEAAPSIASQVNRSITRNDEIFLRANPTFAFNDVSLITRSSGRAVLERLNLRFFSGSVYAVRIPSSDDERRVAFMAVATGMTLPTRGTVTLKSTNLAGLDGAETRSHRIGIVPQRYALRPELNAAQNIVYAMDASRRNFLRPKADIAQALLEQLEYQGGSEPIAEVPKVERCRAAIARAMACEPEVLVLDDPTAGLDSQGSEHVMSLLAKIAHGGPWHRQQPYGDGKHCVIIITDDDRAIRSCEHTFTVE